MRTQKRRHKTVTASDIRPFPKVIVWSACGPLLVAFLMLMPAAPHAQQERPEPPPPGVSWDEPPPNRTSSRSPKEAPQNATPRISPMPEQAVSLPRAIRNKTWWLSKP